MIHPFRRMIGITMRSNPKFRRALLASTIAAGLVLGGCSDGAVESTDSTPAATAIAEPGVVSAETAAELAGRADVVVIDVRTPEEFDEGHLEGATRIGIADADFRDQLDGLDREANYLVYCRSDNRSGQAVEVMREMGFENVWDMDGGIGAWSDAGLPLA